MDPAIKSQGGGGDGVYAALRGCGKRGEVGHVRSFARPFGFASLRLDRCVHLAGVKLGEVAVSLAVILQRALTIAPPKGSGVEPRPSPGGRRAAHSAQVHTPAATFNLV